MNLWTNAAIATLLRHDESQQDAAVRCGEAVSGLVERCTDLTLIRRPMPDIYRSNAADPIILPCIWWPNPIVTAVVGSNDTSLAVDDWPALEYDFDRFRRVYSRGGWPELIAKPGKTSNRLSPPVAQALPTVRISGEAGILAEPLDENLNIPSTATQYADLFGVAEDLLLIIWARRQSGELGAAEDIESGDQKLTWAKTWPMHINKTLERYKSDRNIFGEEALL